MDSATRVATAAAITGGVAAAATALAVTLLARAEGRAAAQPLNATSHWWHGDDAGRVSRIDASHTALGVATHVASAAFWALPFEWWQQTRPPRDSFGLARDAVAMAGVAAFVDYGVVPRRLSPGWDLVLSTRSMIVTYGALALGLVAGSALAGRLLGDARFAHGGLLPTRRWRPETRRELLQQ
jgi:hypothetical protein